MITYKGIIVITKSWSHTIFGFVIVCCAPAVAAFGAVCVYLEYFKKVSPMAL